eukprot:m.279459 g.279459  ORF g.279459 m.279459 type:complete len:312 (-) comp19805_c0_seq13:931-1866(-)
MAENQDIDLFGSAAAVGFQTEIVARCSGTLLSGILHEMTCSSSDCEGLLFGKRLQLTTTAAVTDAAETTGSGLAATTKSIVVVFESFIPTGKPFSFYRADGTLDTEKFNQFTQDREDSLIGWYKFRRNSTLYPSLWERHVHDALQKKISSCAPNDSGNSEILFALFNASFAENFAKHTNDFCVSRKSGNVFENVKFEVSNLDQSMHDGYKAMTSTNIRSANSAHSHDYSGVISALMACQDSTKEGDLQYTQEARAIEKTYKEAVKTVHKLSQQVVASDAQVYALQRELAELRGTAPPARPISSPTRTLSTA